MANQIRMAIIGALRNALTAHKARLLDAHQGQLADIRKAEGAEKLHRAHRINGTCPACGKAVGDMDDAEFEKHHSAMMKQKHTEFEGMVSRSKEGDVKKNSAQGYGAAPPPSPMAVGGSDMAMSEHSRAMAYDEERAKAKKPDLHPNEDPSLHECPKCGGKLKATGPARALAAHYSHGEICSGSGHEFSTRLGKSDDSTTVGTSHFATRYHANKYYKEQGDHTSADVTRKIKSGEIHIGRPTGAGEHKLDEDGRYHTKMAKAEDKCADCGRSGAERATAKYCPTCKDTRPKAPTKGEFGPDGKPAADGFKKDDDWKSVTTTKWMKAEGVVCKTEGCKKTYGHSHENTIAKANKKPSATPGVRSPMWPFPMGMNDPKKPSPTARPAVRGVREGAKLEDDKKDTLDKAGSSGSLPDNRPHEDVRAAHLAKYPMDHEGAHRAAMQPKLGERGFTGSENPVSGWGRIKSKRLITHQMKSEPMDKGLFSAAKRGVATAALAGGMMAGAGSATAAPAKPGAAAKKPAPKPAEKPTYLDMSGPAEKESAFPSIVPKGGLGKVDPMAKAPGPKFVPGDRVRMTGQFLRNTGQHTGSAGLDKFTVQPHDCRNCKDGSWVAVDGPDNSEYLTPEEKAAGVTAPRHIAAGNLEKIKSRIPTGRPAQPVQKAGNLAKMNAADVIGYSHDGALYHPQCVPQARQTGCKCGKIDSNGACVSNCHGYGPQPVFGDSYNEVIDDACGHCREPLVEGGSTGGEGNPADDFQEGTFGQSASQGRLFRSAGMKKIDQPATTAGFKAPAAPAGPKPKMPAAPKMGAQGPTNKSEIEKAGWAGLEHTPGYASALKDGPGVRAAAMGKLGLPSVGGSTGLQKLPSVGGSTGLQKLPSVGGSTGPTNKSEMEKAGPIPAATVPHQPHPGPTTQLDKATYPGYGAVTPDKIQGTIAGLRARVAARSAGREPQGFLEDPAQLVNHAVNARGGQIEDQHSREQADPNHRGGFPRKATGDYQRHQAQAANSLNSPRVMVRPSNHPDVLSQIGSKLSPDRLTDPRDDNMSTQVDSSGPARNKGLRGALQAHGVNVEGRGRSMKAEPSAPGMKKTAESPYDRMVRERKVHDPIDDDVNDPKAYLARRAKRFAEGPPKSDGPSPTKPPAGIPKPKDFHIAGKPVKGK